MANDPRFRRLATGIPNLDAILGGGLPAGSLLIVGGPPGAGKTILAQQFAFHNATAAQPVLYLNTLSESTAKTLRYLQQFEYFDAAKLDQAVRFVDLGGMLRMKGLEHTASAVMDLVKKQRPAIVVIDSFKVFDDLARSREELRRFSYELLVNLIAWECTTLLLGEYSVPESETNPAFSITDGFIELSQRELVGEQQRLLRVTKLRGTAHSRDFHPFRILNAGIEVFAPRIAIRRQSEPEREVERIRTGIPQFDALLGTGIERGSSILVSGVAGTGKTVLSLEFLIRGAAQQGERGLYVSFEETDARLRATARGLGWDLDTLIERGLIEILFVPQPEILVDADLLRIGERIEALGARRVVVDSLSVYLQKVREPHIVREKVFHLASLMQNHDAVGFFVTDVPYGAQSISRYGVEETMVEGLVLLSAEAIGMRRERFIEVYKLRNTDHAKGRHAMTIGRGGVTIVPREDELSTGPR